MLERYERCCDLLHGFDWSLAQRGTGAQRLTLLASAQDHVLAEDDRKRRFMQGVSDLGKAFALAVPHDETIRIRDDVGFFQQVRTYIAKLIETDRSLSGDLDVAIRQIVSKAVSSGEVIDIFAAAGLRNPDIGILSDEFLAEVAEMKHRNLAVELLQKLLRDELKLRSKHNLVQSRSFSEMLDKCYQAAQIMVMRSRWTMAIATADVRDARVRGGDGHRYRARVV